MLFLILQGNAPVLQVPLLPLSFSFSCIKTVQFLLAVPVFQFLLLLFFFSDTADGCEGILVTETSDISYILSPASSALAWEVPC